MSNEPWTEERLQRLIDDGVEESLELEYKRAAALSRSNKYEMAKDISAFANSAGGTIIYGFAEGSSANKEKVPADFDLIDQSAVKKEQVEEYVNLVRPKIVGVRIHIVTIQRFPGKVAVVVEIPQGSTAHQEPSGRYMRRFNFMNVVMLDHEIRDVMNRATAPRLTIEARLEIDHYICHLFVRATNIGRLVPKHYAWDASVPTKIRNRWVDPIVGPHNPASRWQFRSEWYHRFCIVVIPENQPVFPRASVTHRISMTLLDDDRHGAATWGDAARHIRILVFADEMEPIAAYFDPDKMDEFVSPERQTTLEAEESEQGAWE